MTSMTASIETMAAIPPDGEIEMLIVELVRLREANGERKAEFPDLRLERQELSEKSESLLSKAMDRIKEAFDFLVVKPVKWLGEKIKEHPFRTALIALAAFALWYYSAPLSAGLSAIKEMGVGITSDLLGGAMAIDPSQINVFNELMAPPL